jgi:cell division initiation protein
MEKFSYEANGYNRSEVNQFVSDVIKEIEDIVNRVKKQQIEIDSLKKEIAHYKDIEEALKKAVIELEQDKNEQQELSTKQCEILIENAKHNASRIVNDALVRAEKIRGESITLQKNMIKLKNNLKDNINRQQALVDEIEILEINE